VTCESLNLGPVQKKETWNSTQATSTKLHQHPHKRTSDVIGCQIPSLSSRFISIIFIKECNVCLLSTNMLRASARLLSNNSFSKVWITFKDSPPIPVPTANCVTLYDFLKNVKQELAPELDSISILNITAHSESIPLKPSLSITKAFKNVSICFAIFTCHIC
jgi:hypothetical protein